MVSQLQSFMRKHGEFTVHNTLEQMLSHKMLFVSEFPQWSGSAQTICIRKCKHTAINIIILLLTKHDVDNGGLTSDIVDMPAKIT